MKVIICCFSFLLLSICPPLLAMEGTGVALKVSLSGKYTNVSLSSWKKISVRETISGKPDGSLPQEKSIIAFCRTYGWEPAICH